MICTTCLHSLIQTFENGEQTVEKTFCKLLMRDMKGNLVKCGGYEKPKVEYVNFTPYVPPPTRMDAMDKEIKERETNKPDNAYKWCEIGNHWHVTGESYSCRSEIVKPLTQPERMETDWPKREACGSDPTSGIPPGFDEQMGKRSEDFIKKSVTRSERMKEYWKNRKAKEK